jgi:CheY-like chemotaxis protein
MLRVLIADDEHVIADSLAEILARYGYPTTAAYSGTMAV